MGHDPPQEMPADVPEEPAGRKKTCKECSGSGKKPSRFLGTPDDPCPVCAGRGLIEVVEEPLTPWQQEVVTLLRRIEQKLEHPMYHVTFDASSVGPLPAALIEQMKRIGKP